MNIAKECNTTRASVYKTIYDFENKSSLNKNTLKRKRRPCHKNFDSVDKIN